MPKETFETWLTKKAAEVVGCLSIAAEPAGASGCFWSMKGNRHAAVLMAVTEKMNLELAVANLVREAIDLKAKDHFADSCEGCGEPFTTSDCEGVPLCQACFAALAKGS